MECRVLRCLYIVWSAWFVGINVPYSTMDSLHQFWFLSAPQSRSWPTSTSSSVCQSVWKLRLKKSFMKRKSHWKGQLRQSRSQIWWSVGKRENGSGHLFGFIHYFLKVTSTLFCRDHHGIGEVVIGSETVKGGASQGFVFVSDPANIHVAGVNLLYRVAPAYPCSNMHAHTDRNNFIQ